MKRVLLTFLCLCSSLRVFSQKPLLRHFTEKDGLPSNIVYDLFQDKKGFVWIGTDQGVCMFDGNKFQTYTIKDGIPDNEVFTIQEDDFGRCWLVCYKYQPCYIYKGRVYNAANDKLCRSIAAADIQYRSVFKNKARQTCLAGKKMCAINATSMQVIDPGIQFNNGPVDYVLSDSNEFYLTNKTLYVEGRKSTRVLYLFDQTIRLTASHYYNHHLLVSGQDKQGYLFYDFTLKDSTIAAVTQTRIAQFCYNFHAVNDSEVLLLTDAGLLNYNLISHKCERSTLISDLLPINRMIVDNEGNDWLATVSDGVYLLSQSRAALLDKSGGLPQNNISFVTAYPPQQIIMAFKNGTFCIADGGKIRSYRLPVLGPQNRVVYVQKVSPDELFVGSDQGLYLVDIHTGASTRFSISAQKAGTLTNDHFNFASFSKAAQFNVKSHQLKEIWSQRTTAIGEDNTGRVWLGTLEGLYCYERGRVKKFFSNTRLSTARITSLYSWDNKVVIGTHKDGFYFWNGFSLQHLDFSTGLSSNSCKKIVGDGKGNVWLCTDLGIDKVNFKRDSGYSIYKYKPSDGLIYAKVNDIAVLDNKLYAATSDGLVILDQAGGRTMAPPPIYITSIVTNDTVINYPVDFVFNYENHDLQINFTGISFTNGNLLAYKYVLENSGGDTVFTSNTSINLGAVKAGNYHFMVWARAEKGSWSATPARFSFTILPPWWLSTWFIGLMMLLLLTSWFWFYKRKLRLLRLAEEEKMNRQQQLAALEMQALRAQINPHFMFNALNSIQNFFSRNDERKANYYMTSFAQLIRKSLNHSASHWIVLSEETGMLRSYIELEQMRFDHKFKFRIVTDPRIVLETTRIPTMLIQPYVENAINHGLRNADDDADSELILEFLLVDNELKCVIDDNGIGISKSMANKPAGHQSMGMKISSQRIDTINQLYNVSIRLAVIDKANLNDGTTGTRIEIFIPIEYDSANNDNNR